MEPVKQKIYLFGNFIPNEKDTVMVSYNSVLGKTGSGSLGTIDDCMDEDGLERMAKSINANIGWVQRRYRGAIITIYNEVAENVKWNPAMKQLSEDNYTSILNALKKYQSKIRFETA